MQHFRSSSGLWTSRRRNSSAPPEQSPFRTCHSAVLRYRQFPIALYDPRLRCGNPGRGFRPNSTGGKDTGSFRNDQAARWREARQEILRKREQSEAAERQRLDEEEDKFRNPLAPEDILQQCLTLLRKADIDSLRELCSPVAISDNTHPIIVGCETVLESGPLARCYQFMDAASRRVLPGHLLRRSQIMSVFCPTESTFHARVAITGCTGEEVVLFWQLGRDQHGLWKVERVCIDTIEGVPSNFADIEIYQPHPRVPPEAVVRAQVDMLQECNAKGAEVLVTKHRPEGAIIFSSWDGEALIDLLRETEGIPNLGASASPSQRRFLQEVIISRPQLSDITLVWALSLQVNGCWMVDSVSKG